MIYSLDILSPQPSLCVFGEDKYRTKIGVIISIIVFLTSIGFGVYFLYEFFTRANIGLVYMKETHDYINHFNLSDSLFMLYLDERFDESVIEFEITSRYLNSTLQSSIKTPVILEPCKKGVNIPKRYDNIIDDSVIEGMVCLKPGQNITIQYSQEEEIKQNVVLRVKLCNIDKNPKCKTHDEIIDILSGDSVEIGIMLEHNNIDHYNESYPIQPYYMMQMHYPSLEYHYVLNFYWETLTYNTDVGFIFEKTKTDIGVYLDSALTASSVNGRSLDDFNTVLAYYEFALYPYYAEKYTRTYEKLQSVIASIGGILSVVQTIGVILCDFLTGNMLFTLLAKNVVEDKNIYSPGKKKFTFSELLKNKEEKKNSDKKEEVNLVKIEKNEQKEKKYNIDSNLVSNNKKETTPSPITSFFRNSRRRKQNNNGSTNSNLITINKNDIRSDRQSEAIELKSINMKPNEKSINEHIPSLSKEEDKNKEYKVTTTTSLATVDILENMEQPTTTKVKETKKDKASPFNIGIIEHLMYNFGCKKMKGSSMIEISERIIKESLSCEQIIVNNINIEKLIKLLDEQQKEKFDHMKPELIKQIEQRNMIFSVLISKSIAAVNSNV